MVTWLHACQQFYNAAVQERRDAWQKQRVRITRYDQQKQLTALRAEDPFWRSISVHVARSALFRVERAFREFFRRVRAGDRPGYPRFRSRDRYLSFGLSREPRVEVAEGRHSLLHIAHLGPVRYRSYRPLRGKVLDIQVRRTPSGWIVCFRCDVGASPAKLPVRSAIGIDLGLTTFATLSDGQEIQNPRHLARGAEKIASRQRVFARRKRGSNGRRRARLMIARAYERIHNQRLDFARKVAAGLFDQFDLVAHEALNIAGLARGRLSKSVNDAAWGLFLRCLHSKAEEAGKWAVPVDPRGTSQRCSRCDTVVKKTLSERVHRCTACGLVLGRDENAARNVLALGRSAVARGPEGASPATLPEAKAGS